MAIAAVGAEREASADVRIRIGGHAHVRVGGGVSVRTPRVYWRPRWNYARPAPRVHISGSIWVGGGYYYGRTYAAPPPPAYCDCDTSSVPSYYPVAPSATTYAAAPAPELPRFGIGVFAGALDVEGDHVGNDLGLQARLRLTPGLLIQGEIAKTELEDGARVDRRLAAGLVYEIGAYNRWAPFLLGDVGVTQAEVGDDWSTTQSFAEIGGGIRWAITPNLHLGADLRVGSRQNVDEEGTRPAVGIGREVAPSENEAEETFASRAWLMLYL
jgi:hypothetical protein